MTKRQSDEELPREAKRPLQTLRDRVLELADKASRERDPVARAQLEFEQAKAKVILREEEVREAEEGGIPSLRRETRLSLFKAEEYELKEAKLNLQIAEAQKILKKASRKSKKALDAELDGLKGRLDKLNTEWPARALEHKHELERDYPNPVVTAEHQDVSKADLVDSPPSVEELLGLTFPPFYLQDISGRPPVGPDGAVDMRFFPAERPAAMKVLTALRALSGDQVATKMLIAVSGAGKTSTIFQLARDAFTLYIPCTPGAVHAQPTRHERDKSGSFADLEQAVNVTVPAKTSSEQKTVEAKRLCLVFLVAHYFLLLLFLKKFPSATPIQFLLFQLTKTHGRNIFQVVFARLKRLSIEAAGDLARAIREELRPLLAVSNYRVLLAIDEMEGAAKLDNQYISSTGKTGRSLLSPFLQASGAFQIVSAASILVCGTGSSQDRYDTVTSDIGKEGIEQVLANDFPLASRADIVRILSDLPGVTKKMVEDLPNLGYLVNARYRLVARSAEIFMKRMDEPRPSVRLRKSIDISIKQHKERLRASFEEQVVSTSKEVNSLRLKQIHAVYVASRLSNGRMNFATSDLDLCRIGLGAMTEKNVFQVSEQFALEVIEHFFDSNPDLDARLWFKQSVTDLEAVILARCGTATAKGELFENVVFHVFRRACFQDKPVTELAFVSPLESTEEEERRRKEWSSVIFKCRAVRALQVDATDPRFVHDNPNVMVSPQECHRADGIMNLPFDHLVELGIKFYSSNVPTDLVESQFRATNPDKAYGHAEEDAPNEVYAGLRAEWDSLGFNKKKALRIHVNIPKSAVPRDPARRTRCVYYPGTYLMDDDSIVVNIDMSNLHLLFGNPENDEEKKIFDAITRLLAVVNPVEG